MALTIHGNTEGIRASLLNEMAALYEFEVGRDDFAPYELIRQMGLYSARFNREIAVYLSRDGEVIDVVIGETDQVPLPSVRLRRSEKRLSRVRVLHTHPNASAKLSAVDLNALTQLRLDAICAVGVAQDGRLTGVSAAFLSGWEGDRPLIRETEVLPPRRFPGEAWMDWIRDYDQSVSDDSGTNAAKERALLVSIRDDASLRELRALADSAGAEVAGVFVQKRPHPDPATYIGSGKAAQLALEAQALDATLILCDDELSGAQLHNLEQLTSVKTVDRTNLILDIFAQRARTREGKLQVSLAQLKYQMSHLIGFGVSLSRLAGGIGTRGPGETKLEMDRRVIRRRYAQLRQELDDLKAHRDLQRKARVRSQIPTAALVGYTNAGKSTLFNRLTDGQVLVMDRLFATLDATTRRVEDPDGRAYLLTDTVGFITNLPTDLIEAFQSTLEEAALADLLIIVTDASNPESIAQRRVVAETLEKLGAAGHPCLEVLNKMDQALPQVTDAFPDAVRISALTGEGLDALREAVRQKLAIEEIDVTLLIPYDKMKAAALARQFGTQVKEDYQDGGLSLGLRFTPEGYARFCAAAAGILPLDDNNCRVKGNPGC